MSKRAFTFRQAPDKAHFTTGPADSLFIKLNDKSNQGLEGGEAINVVTGETIWLPAGRIVLKAVQEDFNVAGRLYEVNSRMDAIHSLVRPGINDLLNS